MKTPKSSGGMTLIEVLIAVVVLAIGLLGVAAMQLTGTRTNHSAYLRSQATLLAQDIIERMRVNRPAALGGSYDKCSDYPDCKEWSDSVIALLGPEAAGTLIRTGSEVEVRIAWNDIRGDIKDKSGKTKATPGAGGWDSDGRVTFVYKTGL